MANLPAVPYSGVFGSLNRATHMSVIYAAKSSSARLAGLTLLVGTSLFGCDDTARQNTATEPAGQEALVEELTAPVRCEEVDGIKPVCGFTNPEDLAVVPGGDFLLVSEMGAFMSDDPNTLSLLNLLTEARQTIDVDWEDSGERWGDASCVPPDPAKFSPHGIDLITRADGRHQVLVVNHGDEQIEFFELIASGDTWKLHWKGCAKPPADAFINDVAGLRDEGFFVTHMWNKSMPFDEVSTRLTAGEKIGWVWEWQVDTGFTRLPSSVEAMPNGIAVNADNSKIFVNIYMGNKAIRIDRATGEVDGEVAVKNPDNAVVDEEGNLWIASHLNDPIDGRCEEGHPGPCLLPFQVVKVDPDTMQSGVVFEHSGEPMGYVTVALPHNGRLYLGSASGDRVASVEIE